MSAPLRIVLADDAAEMRALLRWALLRRPEAAIEEVVVVGEAADGHEALTMVAELTPDVVVLDLQMPGPPPGELLAAMAAVAVDVPIVTFSGFEPDLIAPVESRLVTLHIPKTTDLALVRAAIIDVARGAGGT
jgi:DNA-binding NarL/FixJ family response regulator